MQQDYIITRGDSLTMKLLVSYLGQIEYAEALEIQNRLLQLRQQEKIEDVLMILEHPPVITVGSRGKAENILVSEAFLQSKGISLHKTNRGGDVTYHGPGQIVGYPILDLKQHNRDIPQYIRKLEETFIRLLQNEYHLSAGRDPKHTGVWVGNEKITAIGCAVKRWVTMHGLAFNVNTNLSHFSWITPCGISDKGVTSLQELTGQPLDLAVVNRQVVTYLADIFDLEPAFLDSTRLKQILEEN